MTTDEITAFFARRIESWLRHDSVALTADFAEGCVIESPAWGTLVGRAAVEKSYREFFTAFPDCGLQAGDPLITGDQVATPMTLYGTDTGGFLGQAPTGKRFRLFVVVLDVLDDRGSITHERRVYDVNGLLLQLATDLGVAAETAQIYRATLERVRLEHDMTIAAEVQRALLPERQHTGAGFEIAGASLPCRAIGGDFSTTSTCRAAPLDLPLATSPGKDRQPRCLPPNCKASLPHSRTPRVRLLRRSRARTKCSCDAPSTRVSPRYCMACCLAMDI